MLNVKNTSSNVQAFMVKWFIINTISLIIIARILPGFTITSWGNAAIAVLVIGLINVTIKPIISILTLPITLVTFGLFSLILNTLMLLFADYLTPGLKIDSFLTAFFASLLLTLITSIFNSLTKK